MGYDMTVLAIDRSTPRGTFAVVCDDEEITFSVFREKAPRSPEWFPTLVAALKKCGLAPAALDAIVIGTGPGSFSGIRAVLAAAQGLALPSDTPVYGVLSSSALAAAEASRASASRVAVVGDARRGSLWLAILDDAAPTPPRLVPYDAAPTALEKLADARIVSPDADRVRAILAQRMERPPEIFEALPTARDVSAFFAAHPEAAVRDPTPAYLHPAVDPHK